MKELSIVIPVYNEEDNIYNALKEVEGTFSNSVLDYEVVVVDDGSTDNSHLEMARAARDNPRIKMVRKENGGKGSALKQGVMHTDGRLVTFIDADLDLHPRQTHLFMDIMRKSDADIVIGSKRDPESKVDYPLTRRALSWCYQLMIKLLFNLNVRDTQAGLKLFKRDVLEDILPRVLVKRYAFDLELLVNANHRGYKIVEAPVEINFHFTSGINILDIWHIFVDTMAIFYRLRILKYYDR